MIFIYINSNIDIIVRQKKSSPHADGEARNAEKKPAFGRDNYRPMNLYPISL